jgi:hypothetical protein
MSRSELLSNRIREVLLDGHWIANTNYKEQIQSVDWTQATRKVESLNSIAALLFHINYYLSGILKAFETSRLDISDKYSFDLPHILSQDSWQKLV